ncbi:MAG: hypothetical protein ABSF92_14550, partial [Candidatus Acidiferrales bacterium]
MATDLEVPAVVVIVAVWFVETDPATAEKVAELEPANTVAAAGTVRAAVLEDDSETAVPPAGAACVRVTVQALAAPEDNVVGVHAKEDRLGLPPVPVTVMATDLEVPAVAVIVAVWFVETDPATAEKVAELEPANTVAAAGTVRAAVLEDDS